MIHVSKRGPWTLLWRHIGRDGFTNHQPHDCLLNRSFRQIKEKHQSSTSLAFVRGIHRWPVNSPHKWPVTRKMLPFDDVIMEQSDNSWIEDTGYTQVSRFDVFLYTCSGWFIHIFQGYFTVTGAILCNCPVYLLKQPWRVQVNRVDSLRTLNPVQPRACHWSCVFWSNFGGVKRTCWTTGSWRSCLSLEVVSSIPAGSTIIYRFLCGFICVSLCQSIKVKPTNIYI